MPQWTEDRPLRVVTGYTYLGEKFFQEKGLKHVQLSTADGALEAAPAVSKLDQRRKLSFEIVEVCQLGPSSSKT
jgi:ATP phosphoribosyltransferase